MKSIALALAAAGSASTSNFFLRKNSTTNYSTNAYLLCYYFISFVVACLCYPSLISSPINPLMFAIGGLVGILNTLLMALTSRALERGPAGLTFAFQNGGAIFPALLLFLLFGETFGFAVTPLQLLGMVIVIFGLWYGCKDNSGVNEKAKSFSQGWLKYALGCFIVQVFILSIFHWRCLLFDCNLPEHPLIPFTLTEADDIWFMPGFFSVATLFQAIVFLREKRMVKFGEMLYGSFGGLANGVSTFFLTLATKLALPFEKTVLFPCFAVAIIIFCSGWGYKVYGEKINLAACGLCALGIFVAM